jgi:hypothetical protein
LDIESNPETKALYWSLLIGFLGEAGVLSLSAKEGEFFDGVFFVPSAGFLLPLGV